MKIVIAGGGTAGWLAALSIARVQKQHEVVLIESSKIGIIGAGEGSTGVFADFVHSRWFDTGINVDEFRQETCSTVKIGIKHVNWKGDGSWYFAPLEGTETTANAPDVDLCNGLIDNPDKFWISSQGGKFFENKMFDDTHSYHFDAFKVGKYFSKIAIEAGTTLIDSEITDVNTENGEIKSLVLSNGDIVDGDLFIDCTGFKRVLMKALSVEWKSYKKHLPVDAAIAFQRPLTSDWEPLTTATALKNGWCWQIPTQERFGCGYVYSSEFTDEDSAVEEVKELYGNDIEILRKFKFESGRSEKLWEGNCIALGLAAAFAEPLEATSIHTTIMQTMSLLFGYLKETKEQTIQPRYINRYNSYFVKMYDDLRDFLIVHYMGGRDDSEFWQYMNSGKVNTDQVDYVLDLCRNGSIPSHLDIDNYNGNAGIQLWNWVLAGTGQIDSTNAENMLKRFGDFGVA